MLEFLCAAPLIGGLLGACAVVAPMAVGYVEGEYVNLAAVSTAELTEVLVTKGDRVAPGQLLARQERTDAEIALAEAEAALAQAEADLANLREGSRREEIAVIEAGLASARVQLAEAARVADRQARLAADGVISEALLDRDISARDVAEAAVRELEAKLEVARLPARPHVVAAAEARRAAAEAARNQAAWRLARRDLAAPAEGAVADVYHRVGEIVGPSTPVLSILPDGMVKLVIYVGERDVSALAPGDMLAVRCDGCPEGLSAEVSHVSDSPEFTPPVIYSVENRQKLVYRVEARPHDGDRFLRPGQIVDVSHAAP